MIARAVCGGRPARTARPAAAPTQIREAGRRSACGARRVGVLLRASVDRLARELAWRAASRPACDDATTRRSRRSRNAPPQAQARTRGPAGGAIRADPSVPIPNLEAADRVSLLLCVNLVTSHGEWVSFVRTLHRPLPTTFRLSTASHDARPSPRRSPTARRCCAARARCRRRRSCAGAAAPKARAEQGGAQGGAVRRARADAALARQVRGTRRAHAAGDRVDGARRPPQGRAAPPRPRPGASRGVEDDAEA